MRKVLAFALGALLALGLAIRADAASLPVGPATFAGVLAQAQPGDLLAFAPGDYPAIVVKRPGVGLRLGAAHVAGVRIQADNVSVSGGVITPSAWWGGVYAADVKAPRIEGAAIAGAGALAGHGTGVVFRNAPGAALLGATIADVGVGVETLDTDGIVIKDVQISRVTADGITGASVRHVLVDGVHCFAFAPAPGKHPDCAQFWTVAGHAQSAHVRVTRARCEDQTQCVTDFGGDARGVADLQVDHSDATVSEPQAFPIQKSAGARSMWNHAHTAPGARFRASINLTAPGVVHCGNTADAALGKKAWADAPCAPPALPGGG